MKKIVFYAAAAVVALAFTLTSCEKYDVSEPLNLSSLRTVTIKGDLYAQLDKTNSTLESAPEGLIVTFSIPLSDYNPESDSDGNHIMTTKTDANGKFSINVPVVSSGVDVTVSFESFISSVLEDIGLTENFEKTWLFERIDLSISGLGAGNSQELIDLGSLVYQPTSSDPNSDSFIPNTSITYEGALTYLVKTKAGVVQTDTSLFGPIPIGTDLLVKIVSKNEFGNKTFKQTKTVTTTAGGKYQIEVPLVTNGTATIQVTSEEILEYENTINDKKYLFVYKLDFTDNLYFVDYTAKDYEYDQDSFVKEVE